MTPIESLTFSRSIDLLAGQVMSKTPILVRRNIYLNQKLIRMNVLNASVHGQVRADKNKQEEAAE